MAVILTKLIEFLKDNWKTIVLMIASGIIVWHMQRTFAKKENDYVKQLDEIAKIHQQKVDDIKAAYEKELVQKEKNIKQLSQDLDLSKEEYNRLKEEIENKKKINIANTTRTFKGDPKGLAKKVNSKLGFEVVLPRGEK